MGVATFWGVAGGTLESRLFREGRGRKGGAALPRGVACGTSEPLRRGAGARLPARGSSHAASHLKDAEGAARQPECHDEPAAGPAPLLPVPLRPRHLLVPAQRLQHLEEALCATEGGWGAGGWGLGGPAPAPGAPDPSAPAAARPGSPQGAPLSPALALGPGLHPL